MKRLLIVVVVLILLTVACWSRVWADSQPQPDGAKVSASATSESGEFLTDEQKLQLEYETRRNADKKKVADTKRRSSGVEYVILPSGLYPDTLQSAPVPTPHNLAVVFAPGTGNREPAYGIQWISPKRWGIGLWASGDLTDEKGLIDAVIPHDDYYMESTKGCYSIQALYSFGSSKTMITVGAGVCVDETDHVAVSNVTGWKWNAGKDRKSSLAGQLGIRTRISNALSIQYGYDSVQRSFFGLTADF